VGKLKKIRWVGFSREDLKEFPDIAQDRIGDGLYEAQLGMFPHFAKHLKGFSGIFEIICDFDKNTYRTVYATKLGDHVYVLHSFQKKSTIGIKPPKPEIDLIKARLQTARLIATGEL
jgi:phage-related protein